MATSPALHRLLALQQRLADLDAEQRQADADDSDEAADLPPATLEASHQLMFAPIGERWHVHYHGPAASTGDTEQPIFAELLDTLAVPAVAQALHALTFTGPDEGANGTRELVFTPLIERGVPFPHLRDLAIPQADNTAHNAVCIVREGEILDDAGDVGRLVALAPGLESLELPQAPDSAFFGVPLPALRRLKIGAGHNPNGFIGHLAHHAAQYPALRQLDFSDVLGPFMQPEGDWPATPFEDYEALFQSAMGGQLWAMVLRNAQLTEAQYRQLHQMRPKASLQVAHNFPGCYVGHWNPEGFAWKHLLVNG